MMFSSSALLNYSDDQYVCLTSSDLKQQALWRPNNDLKHMELLSHTPDEHMNHHTTVTALMLINTTRRRGQMKENKEINK